MRFFLESSRLEEAKKVREWGLLDGVWLSAADAQAAGLEYRRAIRDIAAICDGAVCVEPSSGDPQGVYKGARELAQLGKDVVIRPPISPNGMRVARLLAEDQVAGCGARRQFPPHALNPA